MVFLSSYYNKPLVGAVRRGASYKLKDAATTSARTLLRVAAVRAAALLFTVGEWVLGSGAVRAAALRVIGRTSFSGTFNRCFYSMTWSTPRVHTTP